MQVPVSRLHPFIAPSVPACPEPTIDHFIVVAARELCRRSLAWRVTDAIQTTGAATEVVAIPPNSSLLLLEAAEFDGSPLEFISHSDSRQVFEGVPQFIAQTGANSISLFPPGSGRLTLSMHVMPSISADTLPEFLVDQYATEIASGALAGLLTMPGTNWTNLQLGEVTRARFDATLDRLFAVHMKGQQRAPIRTRADFF